MRYFLLSLVLLPTPAVAGSVFSVSKSHDRPAVNATNTRAGTEVSTDPILGEVSPGVFVDKRTGDPLEGAALADAQERDKYYDDVRDIVLLEAEAEGSKSFLEGKAAGAYGEASVAVGTAGAEGKATLGARSVELEGSARATLIEANAKTQAHTTIGGADVGIVAEVNAMVGAEADGRVSAALTKKGLQAAAGAEVFLGAKVECTITPSATYCGIELKGIATGEASYGVGASAKAYMAFDWTKMKFKFGGKAGLTAGAGAGLDGDVEVSLENLLKDPRANLQCLWDLSRKPEELLMKGAIQVHDILTNRAKNALAGFVEWLDPPSIGDLVLDLTPLAGDAEGWNQPRRTKTVPTSSSGAQGNAGPSTTAGVRR